MGMIDLSKLERNQVTEPFHVAAGVEAFENKPWELSTSECLLYQTHQTRPDTFLRSGNEAHDFLKTLDSDKAQAVQKRADAMCGMAKRLTTSSPVFDSDGKVVSEIPASAYQRIYKENPNLTVPQLEQRVEGVIKNYKILSALLHGTITGGLAYVFILVTPLPAMALIGAIVIGGLAGAAIFFNRGPILENPLLRLFS